MKNTKDYPFITLMENINALKILKGENIIVEAEGVYLWQ